MSISVCYLVSRGLFDQKVETTSLHFIIGYVCHGGTEVYCVLGCIGYMG